MLAHATVITRALEDPRPGRVDGQCPLILTVPSFSSAEPRTGYVHGLTGEEENVMTCVWLILAVLVVAVMVW